MSQIKQPQIGSQIIIDDLCLEPSLKMDNTSRYESPPLIELIAEQSSGQKIDLGEKNSRHVFQHASSMILEDQYFVEDQKQKEKEDFAKYSQDITKLKSYNMKFRLNQFIEFWIYHFIYYTFLGPLTGIITKISGQYLGRNLWFVGGGQFYYVQLVNFFISMSTLFFYFLLENPTIDQSIYLFNFIYAIFIRCTQISTKYATFDPLKIKIYKEVDIKKQDLVYDLFLADWIKQSDKESIIKFPLIISQNLQK